MLMIKMFVLTKINNVTDKIKDILILINITTRRIISKYFMSFCLMSKLFTRSTKQNRSGGILIRHSKNNNNTTTFS